MRYRQLNPQGDSTFASGFTQFLVNSPAAVAQAVQTRLLLMTGEWFLDVTDGTPYSTQIIGKNTTTLYDAAIQARILGTIGVTGIVSYSSNRNPATRAVTVNAQINTIYGATPITVTLGGPVVA
jgi:hypothetical protein